MKMIAINGSPRKDGRTSEAIVAMTAAAEEKGYEVERFDLASLAFKDCLGCKECDISGRCVQDDDMSILYDRILEADHLFMASPIYMGSETGVFNCFIDRLYALLEPVGDGKFTSRIPEGKAATAMMVSGSPDGHIIYHYLTNRLTSIFKGLFGIEDFASFIVPGMNRLESITESVSYKQNFEVFQERL